MSFKQTFFGSNEKLISIGLLIIRLGIGCIFIIHGFPKITGGAEKWLALGGAMQHLGITILPTFWGFMAAVAEFCGGIALILGWATRLAAFLMGCTMLVATIKHLSSGDTFTQYSHPLSLLVVFCGLLFMGAGSFSLDNRFFTR